MESYGMGFNPRKRRRRRPDKPALSAHLLLDERLKDDVGVLSDDLFKGLFPGYKQEDSHNDGVFHVAVTPWVPTSLLSSQSIPWTILPAKRVGVSDSNNKHPHGSLQFSANSLALQSFAEALQSIAANKLTQRQNVPIEIRISDVVPLGLETIYVKLDTDALQKLEEVHKKFGGGFGGAQTNGHRKVSGKAANVAEEQEKVWKKAVRDALKVPKVLHTGDLLPLPLPAHPITHVPPPPAKITTCEPVSQGLLLPSTRIVVIQSHSNAKTRNISAPVSTKSAADGITEEDEDTSNDTEFFSAAEDRTASQAPSPPSEDEETTDNFESLESEMSGAETDDLSADDDEDIISLNAPMLPPQAGGVMSSFSSATPRPGGRTNGIATPGSVFSSFTATTARGPAASKLFKTQGLLQHIPDELLHPKPIPEDDEEARIYVDTSALAKVGCFSGDWVRLEIAAEPSINGFGAWGPGFGQDAETEKQWRAVKLYGLPEHMSKKPTRYPVNRAPRDRSSSFSMFSAPSISAQVYLSPILLANLGGPTHVRLSPLAPSNASSTFPQKKRISGTSYPPVAKEVTLLKVATPLSQDKALQPILFAGLKNHFEAKRRIVKSGDLVAISIDESLGRAVFTPGDDAANDEILSKTTADRNADDDSSKGVAWFKIGRISGPSSDEADESIWGGIFVVDADNTKTLSQGNEEGRLPGIVDNGWQYYLGVKRTLMPPSGPTKGFALTEQPKLYVSSLRRRLRELISAATSPRAIHLGLPPLAILLTSNQRQIGKATIAIRACEDLGLHSFPIDSFDILTDGGAGGGDVKTEEYLRRRAERGLSCGAEYTALILKHVDALNADRMATALKEILANSRVLIATTTEVDKVPDGIRALFTHEMEMSAPDEGEREGILRGIVEDAGIRLAPDVDLSSVAVKTAALVAGDLVDVVDRAIIAKSNRLHTLASSATKCTSQDEPITLKDITLSGGSASTSVTNADFSTAVEAARKNFSDAIGAPKIPNVGWADVGGLTHVKDAVTETIQLPLARPELFAKGMKKRSGILFYGPPGTGKTLVAKAIATEFSLNFFSVKGPELLNMYIGESEANVRRVFQRARDARPCVVFFDELDSVAPKRGNQGDSGGVMDRIVSQLLAELDGMSDGAEGAGGVFVIGATNRPDLLDQALLRPGRFDKMLYLGVSDTHDKQLTILEALTRKFALDSSLSLRRVAEALPFTYTGADLYALCSDAMLKAITRQAQLIDQKVAAYNTQNQRPEGPITIAYFFDHFATPEDTAVQVTEEDFLSAKKELVPSVSVDELRHYEGVRKTFEGNGDAKAKATSTEESGKRSVSASTMPLRPGVSNGMRKSSSGSTAGKGKGKRGGVNRSNSHLDDPSDSDVTAFRNAGSEEDDFVIRTDHLRNGDDDGNAVVGKGKGKGKAAQDGFGDPAAEEDLYG